MKVRIDKWLWAVRVFKTRTLATTACGAGRVKINGGSVKASREVKIGEKITIKKGPLTIIYEVTNLIEKRVSATLAAECYVDHSPPPPPKSVFSKKDAAFIQLPTAFRKRGDGRPTKRDRREIDKLKDEADTSDWDGWEIDDSEDLED